MSIQNGSWNFTFTRALFTKAGIVTFLAKSCFTKCKCPLFSTFGYNWSWVHVVVPIITQVQEEMYSFCKNTAIPIKNDLRAICSFYYQKDNCWKLGPCSLFVLWNTHYFRLEPGKNARISFFICLLSAVFINVAESLACSQRCQTDKTSLTHLSLDCWIPLGSLLFNQNFIFPWTSLKLTTCMSYGWKDCSSGVNPAHPSSSNEPKASTGLNIFRRFAWQKHSMNSPN